MEEDGESATHASLGCKKQKLDNVGGERKPPAYGSQDYWEERYRKNRRIEENETDSDSDALPYHPWYFTYRELSPLIMPLILGGRDEGLNLMGGHEKEECVDLDSGGDKELYSTRRVEKNIQNGDSSTDPSNHGRSNLPADDYGDSEKSDVEYDEMKEDELQRREGLATHGPISILEVGCGDMPLGRDLATELSLLQATTGARAENIVKEIVCCDYSSTVIDMCKEKQAKYLEANPYGSGSVNGSTSASAKSRCVVVNYVAADARKLPYPDSSFHLIMEKGTLDAMLSDKEIGASSCTLIIAECARVLKEGGYIVLVSHINAHTQNGINWLNTVVVAGLRSSGYPLAAWEIEVHGSDGNTEKDFDESEEEWDSGDEEKSGDDEGARKDQVSVVPEGKDITESAQQRNASERDHGNPLGTAGPPSGGPGPAVYIIHNLSKPSRLDLKNGDGAQEDDPPTVPLKFYSY